VHDPIGILDERSRRLQNREIIEYLVELSNKPLKEATWESASFCREVGLIGDNDLPEVGRDVIAQKSKVTLIKVTKPKVYLEARTCILGFLSGALERVIKREKGNKRLHRKVCQKRVLSFGG